MERDNGDQIRLKAFPAGQFMYFHLIPVLSVLLSQILRLLASVSAAPDGKTGP